MTNPEQPRQHDMQSLADSIRAAASKQPHSGHVPAEQGGERPLPQHDDGRPLHETVDPANLPGDTSSLNLEPHETAHLDQRIASTRTPMPPAPQPTAERPARSKRNALVAGGLAGTLAIATIAYLGLRGDSEPSTNENSRDPGVSAPAQPGNDAKGDKKDGQVTTPEGDPITATLDPRINPNVTVYSDNQFDLMEYRGHPNDMDTTLAVDVKVSAMDRLNTHGITAIVDEYPEWDEGLQFYKRYSTTHDTDNILNTMANASVLQSIYADNYVGMAQQYGKAQTFYSSRTAELIGQAPIVSLNEMNTIKDEGQFDSLWSKMHPSINYQEVLIGELQAGNTDPALIDQLTDLALTNSQMLGEINGIDRETQATGLRESLTNLRDSFMAEPEKTVADFEEQQKTAPVLQNRYIAVIDTMRQVAGLPIADTFQENDPDDPSMITTAIVYEAANYSYGNDTSTNHGIASLYVVAFVEAPTQEGAGKYVMPVILDHISQPIEE